MFDVLLDGFNSSYSSKSYETTDKDNNTILTVDVPGVDKDGVDITVQNSILSVKAKRSDKDYTYEFAWRIASHIDLENIKAAVKNGVLNITLVKNPKATKKIVVE
jgi:HSP20 family protein